MIIHRSHPQHSLVFTWCFQAEEDIKQMREHLREGEGEPVVRLVEGGEADAEKGLYAGRHAGLHGTRDRFLNNLT